MKQKLDFLLSELEERAQTLEDSLEKKVKMIGDVNKRLEDIGKKVGNDNALAKLKNLLGDLHSEEYTSQTFRIELKKGEEFSKAKIVTLNKALGVQAVFGYRGKTDGEIYAYIFNKDFWTERTAREWISKHKNDSLSSMILIEKLKGLDSNKQRDVYLADAIKVDAWVDVSGGTIFKDVVFAEEGVQKYIDGMHYKPAKELKVALDSFRGKPIVSYELPTEKVVTKMKQQVGHIVFDTVKWDGKKNRPYGDIFIKKENVRLIKEAKQKKLQDNSIGFRCDITKQSGEFKGVHYDKIQTNFFIDHLALVMRGRSGSEDGVGLNAF